MRKGEMGWFMRHTGILRAGMHIFSLCKNIKAKPNKGWRSDEVKKKKKDKMINPKQKG